MGPVARAWHRDRDRDRPKTPAEASRGGSRRSAPWVVVQKPRSTAQTNATQGAMAAAPATEAATIAPPHPSHPRATASPGRTMAMSQQDEDGLGQRLADLGNAHGCPSEGRGDVRAQQPHSEKLSSNSGRRGEVVDAVAGQAGAEQPPGADRSLAARKGQRPAAGVQGDAQTLDQQDDGETPPQGAEVPGESLGPDGPDGAGQDCHTESETRQLEAAAPERHHRDTASRRRLGMAKNRYATRATVKIHAPPAAA